MATTIENQNNSEYGLSSVIDCMWCNKNKSEINISPKDYNEALPICAICLAKLNLHLVKYMSKRQAEYEAQEEEEERG